MNAAWSDEQARCLDALGFTLYRSAATVASVAAVDARDPLLLGLLRAAGIDPTSCDPARIVDAGDWLRAQQIQSLAQLRDDPAAKRTLWPRLRALRRARTSP
jgi:hypothetical protein